MEDNKYMLSTGVQVRKEDWGLLFYNMNGPLLFFLSSGDLLDCDFFNGELTLRMIEKRFNGGCVASGAFLALKKSLERLKRKGVIVEY